MAYYERLREAVKSPLDPERLRERTKEGWTLVAIEWQREVEGKEQPRETGGILELIPYGFQVADDCLHLKENPQEMETLMRMMELIIQDRSMIWVAKEMNKQGLHMRDGRPWSPAAAFMMLPRLIEVGPQIFSRPEWEDRRKKIFEIV